MSPFLMADSNIFARVKCAFGVAFLVLLLSFVPPQLGRSMGGLNRFLLKLKNNTLLVSVSLVAVISFAIAGGHWTLVVAGVCSGALFLLIWASPDQRGEEEATPVATAVATPVATAVATPVATAVATPVATHVRRRRVVVPAVATHVRPVFNPS